MNIAYTLKKLISYAEVHLGLEYLDRIYLYNRLLQIYKVNEPSAEEVDYSVIKEMKVPDELLDDLRSYLANEQIVPLEDVERFLVYTMGIITPMPSEVLRRFEEIKKTDLHQAFKYLYDLQIKNNYIQKTAVDKNLWWKASFDDNFLEITINLSKPEKNNKDVAKLLSTQSVKYPKCLLCIENLGYEGRSDHPARQNIRYVNFNIDDDKWFIQYSPYVYYNEHCIVINEDHHNMSINHRCFYNLLSIVKQYPVYFFGSNADLPIVGGSILNHEHFQGGEHVMPLMYAKEKVFFTSQFKNTKISYLDWYNSVFKIEGESMDDVYNAMCFIYDKWHSYSNGDIICKTDNQHNTITPIVRFLDNKFVAYLILRNNRTNEKYPDGIFHAHSEYHHIKKESIGLIEAMGLFILPARLKRQCNTIEEILASNDSYTLEDDMLVHQDMINSLIKENGRNLSQEDAHNCVINYINNVCRNILLNTGVFKSKEEMLLFTKSLGWEEK